MGLLTKLKSLLGLEDDHSQVRRGESGVTIEREPDAPVEPDSETESAVKGVDTGAGESATGESEGLDAIVEAEPETTSKASDATDDAETAESDTDATEPDRAVIDGAEETGGEADEPEAEEPEAEEPEAEETGGEADEPEAEEPEVEEGDEPEAEADETADEGEPLEEVKGIGAAYAERLRVAGVSNVAELAAADPEALAEETDISAKRISTWVDRANAR